jgi:uncharacterized protein (TIGR02001 family)
MGYFAQRSSLKSQLSHAYAMLYLYTDFNDINHACLAFMLKIAQNLCAKCEQIGTIRASCLCHLSALQRNTMKLTKLSLAALLSVVSIGAFAQAKAPEPDFTLSYNVGLVTDYRFRGIAQTSKKPALQGGVDFAHKSGLYLGVWGSNVKWVKDFNGATKGNLEIDLYGGFKGEIVKDLGFDVGLITYRYPGNNSGAVGTPGVGSYSNANTNEYYGALTYKVVTAKYSRSSGDFLGNIKSSGSSYFDLSAAFDLGNGFTLTPHVGVQKVKNSPLFDYTDYSLTVAKDMGNGFSLTAAAIGTNAKKPQYVDFKGKYIGNGTLVVGAKYSF